MFLGVLHVACSMSRLIQIICCTGRRLPTRTESKARSSSLTRSSSAVPKSNIRNIVSVAPAHAKHAPATNCFHHFVHTPAVYPYWFRCVLRCLTHECSFLAADPSTSAADMLTRKSMHSLQCRVCLKCDLFIHDLEHSPLLVKVA